MHAGQPDGSSADSYFAPCGESAFVRIEYSVSVRGRRGGWWGVAFVVTLTVGAGMVSVPTATQSGREISAFYAAHAAVILIQQLLGVVALGFLIGFAVARGARTRRWLMIGIHIL